MYKVNTIPIVRSGGKRETVEHCSSQDLCAIGFDCLQFASPSATVESPCIHTAVRLCSPILEVQFPVHYIWNEDII